MNASKHENSGSSLFDCHAQILTSEKAKFNPDMDPCDPAQDSGMIQDGLSVDDYREVSKKLSVAGVVLLQPEEQGSDNQFLIETVAGLNQADMAGGLDKAVGVATLRLDIKDDELQTLKESGIVGAQFIMTAGKEKYEWDEAERLAWRINDFGWSVDLQMDGSDLHEVEQRLASWPGQIIIHHIGMFLRTKTLKQRGFKALTRLIDRDKAWVKLSGPYNSSRTGLIDDPEVAEIAQALINWAPERMVWGTNWPHLERSEDFPDDNELFRVFSEWVPESSRRKLILTENPTTLYGIKKPQVEPDVIEKRNAFL
jgi:D-galactarolactone isomerase